MHKCKMMALKVHFEPIGKVAHSSEDTEKENGPTVEKWPLETFTIDNKFTITNL